MPVAAAAMAAALAAGAAAAAEGETLFRKACAGCHSVASAGIRAQIPPGHELGGLGGRMDAATLRAVISGEATGVKRHRPFKGTEDDVQALIAWLLAAE